MRNTITIERSVRLDAQAERVWDAVRTPQAFRTVTRGVVRFPVIARRDAEWVEGEVVVGWTWLFGVVPFNRHHLTVARIDHDRMTLSSDEHGGMIRSWRHDIVVEAEGPDACRYVDRVAIDAGPMTVPVVAYAWWFYWVRQRRWMRLARSLTRDGASASSARTVRSEEVAR